MDVVLEAPKEEQMTLLGMKPELVADLRVGWDLSDALGVRRLWAYLAERNPLLTIVSPLGDRLRRPCNPQR